LQFVGLGSGFFLHVVTEGHPKCLEEGFGISITLRRCHEDEVEANLAFNLIELDLRKIDWSRIPTA
jgi:hypothetical protein